MIHILLANADEHQYPLFLPRAQASATSALKAMREELGRTLQTAGDYTQREILAARKANALITLARLGETDALWPALRQAPDPRVRTYLIQRLVRFGVEPRLLADHFSTEKEPSVRAALLLALAENPDSGKPPEIPVAFVDQLITEYANDPDPGFHSAAFWLLDGSGAISTTPSRLTILSKGKRPLDRAFGMSMEPGKLS